MRQSKFNTNDIPFGILERFGLTQDMVEDLPESVLDDICNGHCSPVLPISYTTADGNTVMARSQFRLVSREDGQTDIVFYPKLREHNLAEFSADERKALMSRQAVNTSRPTSEGVEEHVYIQLQPSTKQIMSVPTPVIDHNLSILRQEYNLSAAELVCLRKGEPLTVLLDDHPVTFGVDLNSRKGVKIVYGDAEKWRNEIAPGIERYNFGLYGAWVMNSDGDLDYVAEEDYTEEMLMEQRKKIGNLSCQLSRASR